MTLNVDNLPMRLDVCTWIIRPNRRWGSQDSQDSLGVSVAAHLVKGVITRLVVCLLVAWSIVAYSRASWSEDLPMKSAGYGSWSVEEHETCRLDIDCIDIDSQ